jgi:hypothetical protein
MAAQTPVNNFMVPATGTPNSVPVQGPFSATPLVIDFRENGLDGSPFVPQGLFADNTTGSAPLVIAIQGMNWSVVVPTGSQLGCQYPAPIGQIVSITGNNAGGSIVFCDFPVLPFNNSAAGAGGGPVTIADGADVTMGARADAPAANDTGTFSLMSFIKKISGGITTLVGKIPGLGVATSANSLPVVIASDDAQIGTKVTAVPALGAGGTGIIGWLSNIVSKFSPDGFPPGATFVGGSSTGGNVALTVTIPAVAGRRNYITGIQIGGGGATAANAITLTVTNAQGGTLNYSIIVPVLGSGVNHIIPFPMPLCASAVNTAMVVTLPAFGAGNGLVSLAVQGYNV